MTSYERELGTLTAKLERLENDVSDMKHDVRKISETMDQAKGGWKAIALVSGIAGTVGAVLTKFAPFLIALPR